MIEGEPIRKQKVADQLRRKDEIRDPVALSIRAIKRALSLRFLHLPQESGSLSAEGRLIRNAGILISRFSSRFLDDEIDIERRRSDQDFRKKKIDENDFEDKKNEVNLRASFKKAKEKEQKHEDMRKGKHKTPVVKKFIRDMQIRIPYTLRIVPEFEEVYKQLDDPILTIEELIALSVIHKGQKPEVIEKARSYLMHSDGLGGLVLAQLEEYLLTLDRGYLAAVFRDKHATPLRKGDINPK